MKLLAVALLLLPLSVCWAEVVNDFIQRCPGFFATPNGVVSPPTRFNGPQYRQICQTLNGQIEFATFYDTANKIPVYSAYRFNGRMSCARNTGNWFIEPQLDDQNRGNDMAPESAVNPQSLGLHQAVNGDYSDQRVYDKGHLAPVCHQNMQDCATATFTLTNAALQVHSFNVKWYHYTENVVSKILTTYCIEPVGLNPYVVTGVVPGSATINNRVRVPSHFWSAYCCLDNNNVPIHSGGYIGINREIVGSDTGVVRMRVKDLEDVLTDLYGLDNNSPFLLFGGKCHEEIQLEEKPKPQKRPCRRPLKLVDRKRGKKLK